jgi:hypothetical protein
MVTVNSYHEFLYTDVGKGVRVSDGGVMKVTSFYKKLKNGTLNLPDNKENDEELNYAFTGDEAFAFHRQTLTPDSRRDLTNERRTFTYQIAWTLNVVENEFGLIASVFSVLHISIIVLC